MIGHPLQPLYVYVHIPFCARKCYYCDFATYTTTRKSVIDDYLAALEKEMTIVLNQRPSERIETLYIGGGTPTILTTEQLEQLFLLLERFFPIRSETFEFTVEVNPGTVDEAKLSVMKEHGVNRLSFGAQTFNDNLLQTLGRDHDAHTIDESVSLAKQVGFSNISLDIMFGLPQQTLHDVMETLERVLSLNVQHISAYSLIVEENTPFAAWERAGTLRLPSDDEEYEMYQLIRKQLRQAGFIQYEVSNFSRSGFESKHNLAYWLNKPYDAFGVGAHGYDGQFRFANTRSVKTYIQQLNEGQLARDEYYRVSREEDMENTMILGLRLLRGVPLSVFEERFGVHLMDVYGDKIEELMNKGWIALNDESIRLSERGLLWGNEVFSYFLFS